MSRELTGSQCRRLPFSVAFFVALLLGCHTADSKSSAGSKTTQATFDSDSGPVTLTLEVADTEATRERGLMNRKSMPADSGMVFVFSSPGLHTFWMKNTYIPLDMLFIDSDHKVTGIVPSAEPLTLSGRGVPGLSKLVVELNGGTCAKLGIHAESRITFDRLDDAVE
jgi:uncharacterized protein